MITAKVLAHSVSPVEHQATPIVCHGVPAPKVHWELVEGYRGNERVTPMTLKERLTLAWGVLRSKERAYEIYLTKNELPKGLVLNPSTGEIQGTPVGACTASIQVRGFRIPVGYTLVKLPRGAI